MHKRKVYHYVKKTNNVLKEGILSFARNKNADLSHYVKRSAQTTHEGIVCWFEQCFKGRSRGIRVFSEPIKWHEKSLSLKDFVQGADLFSIDLDALQKDGLIEAVYVSPSVLQTPDLNAEALLDEVLIKLNSIDDIDFSALDWSVCDDASGRRFAFVRYYLIVVKDGVIGPKYLTLESL